MPRFAANLTMLFTEHPFLDRFALAAQAGFKAVEFLFPYAWDATVIKSRLEHNNLKLVLHNLPAGDWEAGDRGIACQPEKVAEFQAGVLKALDYAKALGVSQLNCLIGKPGALHAEEVVHQTVIENLVYASKLLAPHGIRLLIEPINTFDIPGFYLNRIGQALALLDAVSNAGGASNVFVQYDIYHAQRMEGELAATITKNLSRIGHIQLADNPGRNEPGSGEIHYPYLFNLLDRIGYEGWVGCEYKPATTTQAGLTWLHSLANQPNQ